MKFCPKCEVRLKKDTTNSLSCPKCGYSETGSEETKKKSKEATEEELSELNVLEENEGKEALPSITFLDCSI